MASRRAVALCLAFCLPLAACSKELSRSAAAERIRTKAGYPEKVFMTFPLTKDLHGPDAEKPYEKTPFDKALESKGLATVSTRIVEKRSDFGGMVPVLEVSYDFTEAGKKVFVAAQDVSILGVQPVWKGVVGERHFKEVTGIAPVPFMPETAREVRFTLVNRNPTPLAEIQALVETELHPFKDGAILEKTAEFVRYDDGWRCESIE